MNLRNRLDALDAVFDDLPMSHKDGMRIFGMLMLSNPFDNGEMDLSHLSEEDRAFVEANQDRFLKYLQAMTKRKEGKRYRY